jgi:hypothetical protein
MAKATFIVEVEYSKRKTDPEALASALDTLMETALSTPDILDDYGKISVGEFLVHNRKTCEYGDAKTVWKCPKCGDTQEAGPDDMAEVGTPFCAECDCDMAPDNEEEV